MDSGHISEEPWLPGCTLTVTPTTTPAWGLFELTSSEKSWSWICKYGLKSPAGGIWGEHNPTEIAAYRSQEVAEPPDDLGAGSRIGRNDQHWLCEDEALPERPQGREERCEGAERGRVGQRHE
jgi:hypothetical protein